MGFIKVDYFIRGAGRRPAPEFPIMWMRGKDQRGKGYGPNFDPSEGRSKRVCLAGRSLLNKPMTKTELTESNCRTPGNKQEGVTARSFGSCMPIVSSEKTEFKETSFWGGRVTESWER